MTFVECRKALMVLSAPEDDRFHEWLAAHAEQVFRLCVIQGKAFFQALGPEPDVRQVPINITSRSPGALRLISNFAPTPFVLDGLDYGSVEAFWQGLKFPDEATRREIAPLHGTAAKDAGFHAPAAEAIFHAGSRVRIGTWEHWRLMHRACLAKFEQNGVAHGPANPQMAKADGFEMLQGHVEADEAYVGGRRPGKRGRGAAGKTIVFGMQERGGRLHAEPIPDIKKATLRDAVLRTVEPGATVSTDELMSYGLLEKDGYKHGAVNHAAKEWAYYDYRHGVTHHTNTVESFWKLFKVSVRSTHIHVSQKYMDRYLREFTFRANHRQMENAMFDLLIGAV